MTRTWARDAAAAAALMFFAFFLFGMTVSAPVFLDDWSYVVDAPFLRVPWGDFLRALLSRDYFAFTAERTWQPLVTLFHYFFRSPYAFRPAGILLHALNAVLLRGAARRLGWSETRATAAAGLWLVFPFHSEAVFLSAFKGHLIAAASSLGTLWAWQNATVNRLDKRWLLASQVIFAVGLLGKESSLVGPALIALYVLLNDQKHLKLLIGHGVVSVIYLTWRFALLHPPPAVLFPAERRPLASLGWYLWSMIWPYPACLARTLKPGVWPAALIAPYAVLVSMTRRSPRTAFALLWMPAALLPFLHIIPFAHFNPVADRYLYLPSAGLCLALAEFWDIQAARLALAVLGLIWAGLLARRNGQFRDLPGTCAQTALCAPDNPMAHSLLGEHLLTMGEFMDARVAFEHAAALEPRDPDIQNNLGMTLFQTGDKAAALAAFDAALAVKETAGYRNNRGLVLAALGRRAEAQGEFDRAIVLRPDWYKPYENEADLFARTDKARARALLTKALELQRR